jgi:glucosamine-phosphate N-acetyltransferase
MEKQLFAKELVSREIAQSLPKGYTLRPLQFGDFDRGVLEVLEVLTTVGTISKEKYLGTLSLQSLDLDTVALLRPGL